MSDDELWQALKRLTPARLALGLTGASLPTRALLEFDLAHAMARDAVHSAVDWQQLSARIGELTDVPVTVAQSAAPDRATYLRRPDLGRRLSDVSRAQMLNSRLTPPADIVLVLADGLSASAIEHHAAHMVEAILDSPSGSRLGAVVLAHNARVALADEIGALFQARFVVIAIGERPGLSSPDSLGLYLTYQPKVGRRDSERNCLSNIHAAGLSYHVAARKLDALITGAARIGASGTKLKDETDATGHLLDAPRPVDTSTIK